MERSFRSSKNQQLTGWDNNMRRIKSHTIEKLEYIKKYINAYLTATKRLPVKYYIDAFAGSGKCVLCDVACESDGGLRCIKCGKGKIVDGSTMIALNAKDRFRGYLFIELNNKNLDDLDGCIKKLDQESQKTVTLKRGDSNVILQDIYKHIPKQAGCLILLDPEGPELYWTTIKYLAKINKADLLILYPYDMALVRLTKEYGEKLNLFYGGEGWLEIYQDKNNFSSERKKKALLNFYVDNLKKLGFAYVAYKQIKRRLREGNPLYHLILASHHPAAKKIMDDIFNKELDGQTRLKLRSRF